MLRAVSQTVFFDEAVASSSMKRMEGASAGRPDLLPATRNHGIEQAGGARRQVRQVPEDLRHRAYEYLGPGRWSEHQAGIARRWWARPAWAVSSRPPATTRTPSSMRTATVSGVQASRKAAPFARQAAKTRSRASCISGG